MVSGDAKSSGSSSSSPAAAAAAPAASAANNYAAAAAAPAVSAAPVVPEKVYEGTVQTVWETVDEWTTVYDYQKRK